MASGKFFFVALGSLILYTLFINLGYVNFMDAQLYNVYLYDPAGTQTELTPAVVSQMSCFMRQQKKQTSTERTMRCPCFPRMGTIQQKQSAAIAQK